MRVAGTRLTYLDWLSAADNAVFSARSKTGSPVWLLKSVTSSQSRSANAIAGSATSRPSRLRTRFEAERQRKSGGARGQHDSGGDSAPAARSARQAERRQGDGARLNGLERGEDFAGLPVAAPRLLRETSFDHHGQRRGHLQRYGNGRLRQHAGRELERRPARRTAGARSAISYNHDAERPDVAARVGRIATQHFGRHVRRRPRQVGGGQRRYRRSIA